MGSEISDKVASREEHDRFRLVFDNSLIGIFVVDCDRRIIEINDRACQLFGHDAAELLGESVEVLHLSRASFQRFGQEVFSRIRSTGVADVHYELKRANGEVFQAALSGRPLNGVDRADGVIWVIDDISRTARAENALRASEERFALAVAGSNAGIWDWDIPTNRVYFSPRWKELIGYRDEEIPNRFEEWVERVHPDDLSGANAAIEAHLRGETELLATEFRMRCKDGSWRWILGHGLCVRDEQGRPLRMAGSNSDVDARRRAEDRARAQEAHLAAVLDTVQTGIVVIDHDLREVVDANEQAARILGTVREELIGSLCSEHLCLNPNACPFERGVPENWRSVSNDESVFVRADGTQVSVLKSLAPLQTAESNLLIESFVDVTPMKQTEQALRRAKEEAESAALAKSEFLAKMSHEIRTPMNSILGMTKLTLDSRLDTEQRENLEIVDAAAEALLALIDDILDFSKLEARRVLIDPVDFDLSVLFEEVLDGFALRAAEKELELIEFIDPQVPLGLKGDNQRLRQVLINLLGNAIKFTATGEVVLSVELAPENCGPDGPLAPPVPPVPRVQVKWLRFAVRDTGVGVAPEKQADIFSAFQQADNSVTREYGGSGLGLSISRQLVELMGGRLELTSTLGQGSEFSFLLPLEPASSPLPSANLAAPELRGLRCLVVDDNSANRRLLVKTLNGWGCKPHAVPGGAEALEALQQAHAAGDPFRLVLLDLLMPGMDGEQSARAIQGDGTCGAPDILLLASASVRGQAARLRALGVRSLLIKPVKHRQLLRAMSQALTLPLGPLADASQAANAKVVSQSPRFAGAQVLLVEDRLFNRKVAASYLSRFGIEVMTAGNGLQALELSRTRAFDLILMDIQMPLMDGFQTTVAIRDEPGNLNRSTPIVAMTAQALEGDRDKCLQAGMDDYLSKPIRLELLERALRRWLNDAEKRPRPSVDSSADQAVTPDPRSCALPGPPQALPAELESLFDNDPEGLADLLRTFVSDARADLDALLDGWRERDIGRMQGRLHALTGLVANMGFATAAERLAAMQVAVREVERNQTPDTGLDTAALEAPLAEARGAVTALIEGLDAEARCDPLS
ncbi:PAS domain S-box protein [Thiorhodovibrio frisius]|uniref:Sensory/regulatory protein RpfC n=1 Tax=Thiorhodovibrio frisius TaxID=631362 RepID=H8Z5D9_9GAMM|nr:PAS domain S-box protein [Thiorhodovibrio frisius]EIC20546.1 PAS domain S-box [Thiorhodovibrio frisius]WPL21294.1 Signal transduction histidine-protein kinase BarA [Thiorhodovibrio frisius]